MADVNSRAGHGYATPAIVEYVNRVHAPHDAALAQAFTVPPPLPAIMVAPSDGKLVEFLLALIGARRVLEVGTLVGYSGLRILRALPADGHLWTLEFDAAHAAVARSNFAAAGEVARVTVCEGRARDVLPTLIPHGPFDAVFIDADKENYHHYAAWALRNVRPGGLIIGDNTFLFGELLDDSERGQAMRAFHEQLAATCDTVSVSTPDGMVVARVR